MPDVFSDFLANPSEKTYRDLRQAVVTAPDYDFHSSADQELSDLVQSEQYAAVGAKLPELMPNWLLSARVHNLFGFAAGQLGDKETAQREGYLAKACLKGLLASGDGSRLRPYPVTHVADEYDILEVLGKEMRAHRSLTEADGVYDVLTCEDGSELWFDISAGARS